MEETALLPLLDGQTIEDGAKAKLSLHVLLSVNMSLSIFIPTVSVYGKFLSWYLLGRGKIYRNRRDTSDSQSDHEEQLIFLVSDVVKRDKYSGSLKSLLLLSSRHKFAGIYGIGLTLLRQAANDGRYPDTKSVPGFGTCVSLVLPLQKGTNRLNQLRDCVSAGFLPASPTGFAGEYATTPPANSFYSTPGLLYFPENFTTGATVNDVAHDITSNK